MKTNNSSHNIFLSLYMNQYKLIHQVGKGSYGIVNKVSKKSNNKIYAMKLLLTSQAKNRYDILSVIDELKILSFHKSNYLLRCHDIFYQHGKVHLVTDFAKFSDLNHFIAKHRNKNTNISEKIIWTIFIKCCYGLAYLHSHNIIHRDLKPANILLHEKCAVWIADFGVSKILHEKPGSHTMIGTPYYISPEMFGNCHYGKKVDIWALGCILYEMIALCVPFEGRSIIDLKRRIMNGKLKWNDRFHQNIYSEDMIHMVKFLLQKDCKQRPTIDAIIESKIFQKRACMYNLLDNSLFNQSFQRKLSISPQTPRDENGWKRLIYDIEKGKHSKSTVSNKIQVKPLEYVQMNIPSRPTRPTRPTRLTRPCISDNTIQSISHVNIIQKERLLSQAPKLPKIKETLREDQIKRSIIPDTPIVHNNIENERYKRHNNRHKSRPNRNINLIQLPKLAIHRQKNNANLY